MVPTATVMNTPNRAFSRPNGPLPLVRISDVFAGPATFRAAMCGCGTCSKMAPACAPGGPVLEAAVSVTEAGYLTIRKAIRKEQHGTATVAKAWGSPSSVSGLCARNATTLRSGFLTRIAAGRLVAPYWLGLCANPVVIAEGTLRLVVT